MMLYGRNPVLERIRANPATIKKLYLQKRANLSAIVREAKKENISFFSLDKKDMRKLTGDIHSQGVAAEVSDYSYSPFDKLLRETLDKGILMVFLDGITDPQNLGAIIRTLACLGGYSLVIPGFKAAGINETVLRVASGGENYIEISRVANIATSIEKARRLGIRITGADVRSSRSIYDLIISTPLALVIGSEGKGIRPGVSKKLDTDFFIPMKGAGLSFNAAISAAIITSEFSRKLTVKMQE
jgi:23S rRNA (guanosine2251-2'-O)-methyltransferase